MNRHHPRPGGRRWPLVGLVLALLAGCGQPAVQVAAPTSAPPPPPPTELVLDVSASARMNPTGSGQAAPLLVRSYELTAPGGFLEADLNRLLEADQGVLGAALLAREETRFIPGERRQLRKTLNPATRTLGVMAAYRDTDRVRWRATVPIIPATVNTLQLGLGPRELTLAPAP